MARHPMSSSWPQLTARTSVSGQSSRLALQEDIHRADGSDHDHHRHPRRRQVAAPGEVRDTGARSLWIGVQPQVSRRSHPVPCSAIRFQALLVVLWPAQRLDPVGGADMLAGPGGTGNLAVGDVAQQHMSKRVLGFACHRGRPLAADELLTFQPVQERRGFGAA
jgi:hypothetical protein